MADTTVIDLLVHETMHIEHDSLRLFFVSTGDCCASVSSHTKKFLTITCVFVH